jgi:hypothetical protein
MNEIILTMPAKLGDGLYALMVGSWIYKKFGRKIHCVLPDSFGPFRYIKNLLLLQEQISRVTLVPHKIADFSCGGQPYQFDPAIYGVEGEYFNLGFRHGPDKFIPEFYAEEHGLGYDPDFTLKIFNEDPDHFTKDGKPKGLIYGVTGVDGSSLDCTCMYNNEKILRSSELAMQMLMPNVEPLPTSIDLLELVRMIAAAKEVHSWYCGIAVLCWLARIPAHVYRVPGHGAMDIYFPDKRTLTFHELPKHPKEMHND